MLEELRRSDILPTGVGHPDASTWVPRQPVMHVSLLVVRVGGRCAVQVHLDPVDSGTADAVVVTCCMVVEIAGPRTDCVEDAAPEVLGSEGRTWKVGSVEWASDDRRLLDMRTQRMGLRSLPLVVVSKTSCRVRYG